MPERLLRVTLTALLRLLFRVRVRGLAHFEGLRGQPALVIANHQSFLDPLLLAVFLPEKPAFAMDAFQARKWYFRPLLKLVDVFTVDPAQPMATKTIIHRLQAGRKVVVFPEGRITTSGGLMKVYEGTGLIVDRTGVPVLPVWVEGAQYSKLSRLQGKARLRRFPRITLTFQPPLRMELPPDVQGKARRALAAQRIYDMLGEASLHAKNTRQPVLCALAAASRLHGLRRVIATGPEREKLTYRALWMRAFVLGRILKTDVGTASNAGILLPTSPGAVIAFMALHLLRRMPAMLNFSAGLRNLQLACETAQLECILTSRAFVDKAELGEVVAALAERCRILYLEDMRPRVRATDKLAALFSTLCLRRRVAARLRGVAADDAAVILFTSGSEGVPKGVALSHANLLSNVAQAAARFGFTESDVMFNALPVFHSFGLTGGTLLPLLLGIRVWFYPNPLHYRVIPELIYDSGATILIGTDTFYNGYANYAHPYDFHTLRLAVAGAEKLRPATRQLYAERFRVNILEGYGVTEAAPIVACNTPVEHKGGTVGRLMPGMRARLAPVEGLSEGGMLEVSGPNVMLGYLKPDRPGVIQLQGEWYGTGDIVTIDAEGFITIQGRAKRFAKTGGEMVSLAAVEEMAAALWPEHAHAAMAVADARKGEQIVLLTECAAATREALIAYIKAHGLPEIALPRRVIAVEALSRLGSGKVDYTALRELIPSLS